MNLNDLRILAEKVGVPIKEAVCSNHEYIK